jgi:hypothetical protein
MAGGVVRDATEGLLTGGLVAVVVVWLRLRRGTGGGPPPQVPHGGSVGWHVPPLQAPGVLIGFQGRDAGVRHASA